tara:strand:+ start:4066 stop:4509 length:444 start_codon:yes stop_codon:yes gene_type:complete
MVVLAKDDDVDAIAPFMRKPDKLEVSCMGHTPEEALRSGLKNDDATFTVLCPEGVPIAMFGSGRIAGQAYIWLLGTDALLDNAYAFIKASRPWVHLLTAPYKTVVNYVHEDNELAIKWLRFCGAKFIRKLEFSNQPFYEFIIISNNV